MNNYTSVRTETFQKLSKKSKSYDNTERNGSASSNKKFACKSSYKQARSMKREWRED